MLQTTEEVDEENQNRDADQESRNGHDQMRGIKTKRRIIIHDSAAHPAQTNHHHTEGQHKERGSHKPEVHFAPEFAHTATGGFGIPVIDCSKKREYKATENRIVEVANYPISIMQVEIK